MSGREQVELYRRNKRLLPAVPHTSVGEQLAGHKAWVNAFLGPVPSSAAAAAAAAASAGAVLNATAPTALLPPRGVTPRLVLDENGQIAVKLTPEM